MSKSVLVKFKKGNLRKLPKKAVVSAISGAAAAHSCLIDEKLGYLSNYKTVYSNAEERYQKVIDNVDLVLL